MTEKPEKILAVGATGKFAGLVLPELAKRGAIVRGLIRNANQAEQVRAQGAAETAVGDLRDRESLDQALKGIDKIFYIAPAFMHNEADIGKNMVTAALAAGVKRFVFSSVIHPTLTTLVNHSAKAPVEEAVLISGIDYVFLQPTMFFQNLAPAFQATRSSGIFAEPWSTDTRFSRVDYRDVAEVAAISLTEDRLINGTFELCAKGSLNRHEVAALMSQALGRPITAQKSQIIPRDIYSQDPEENHKLANLHRMFSWYDTHDLMGNALVLQTILGREPRTLQSYFQELANEGGPEEMPAASNRMPRSPAVPDDNPQ